MMCFDRRAIDGPAVDDGPDQAFLAGTGTAVLLALKEGGLLDDSEPLALSGLDGLSRAKLDHVHAALL